MSEHSLMVSTQPMRGGDPAPRLDLTGPWLTEAGFPAGSRVEVEVVEPGRLVVTRVAGGAVAHAAAFGLAAGPTTGGDGGGLSWLSVA